MKNKMKNKIIQGSDSSITIRLGKRYTEIEGLEGGAEGVTMEVLPDGLYQFRRSDGQLLGRPVRPHIIRDYSLD